MLEILMRLGIILVGDMKQEAIRQFLRWDGREMGSWKKKGNVFTTKNFGPSHVLHHLI